MAQEVRYTSFERADIFNRKLLFVEPAVHLERADSGNDDHRVGRKSRHAALYIEELFGTEICAESRFGDGIIAHLERHLSRHDGVAAVRYVRERSAVDERRRALRLGFRASFKSAVIAPAALSSPQVTGLSS